MCICEIEKMCVCVCPREGERDREADRETGNKIDKSNTLHYSIKLKKYIYF